MRIAPTKRQIDQLIICGIDSRLLPEPRPESKTSQSAPTRSTQVDSFSKTPNRASPASGTAGSPLPQTATSTPGSAVFVIIAIIVFLIILLVRSASADGEHYSIPATNSISQPRMPDSSKAGHVTQPSGRNSKSDEVTCALLTNILKAIDRLDHRMDAMARDSDCRAKQQQLQAVCIDRHISLASRASVAAVSLSVASISNCLVQTGMPMASSLQSISDTQDMICHFLPTIRNLVVVTVIMLLLFAVLFFLLAYRHGICSSAKSTSAVKSTNADSAQSKPVSLTFQAKDIVPTPAEILIRLSDSANDNPDVHIKPAACPEGWKAGFCTSKGPFRSNNQDFGLVFGVGNRLAIIVGDGVGGLLSGAEASCCAVAAAASHLVYYLGGDPAEDDLPNIARQAMQSASHALTYRALHKKKSGMRTTLAIVLATPIKYYAESIGDGQVVVVRENGTVERLVEPQRVPGAPSNVLAASLGPVIEGESQSSSLPVLSGDLVISGSDGLWNIVDDDFPQALLAAAKQFQGDIQCVADTVVRNLVEETDPLRLPCRDNLTIALAYRNDAVGGNSV